MGTISTDPIGFDAGDANLYRYVGNHGTYASDPSGLEDLGLEEQSRHAAEGLAYARMIVEMRQRIWEGKRRVKEHYWFDLRAKKGLEKQISLWESDLVLFHEHLERYQDVELVAYGGFLASETRFKFSGGKGRDGLIAIALEEQLYGLPYGSGDQTIMGLESCASPLDALAAGGAGGLAAFLSRASHGAIARATVCETTAEATGIPIPTRLGKGASEGFEAVGNAGTSNAQRVAREVTTDTVRVPQGVGREAWVNPNDVRFSQRTITPNSYQKVMESGGWKWSQDNPLIVIERPDGTLISLDNRRLAAARRASNVDSVPIRILKPEDRYLDYKTWRTVQEAFDWRATHPKTLRHGGVIPPEGLDDLPAVIPK